MYIFVIEITIVVQEALFYVFRYNFQTKCNNKTRIVTMYTGFINAWLNV